jgi:hypothetical protein
VGVDYYLVDLERKEVLDVGKWYALEAEYGSVVTREQLAAADPHPAVLPWAEGRTLICISDSASGEPWIDHADPYQRWLPGWRVWEIWGDGGLREARDPMAPAQQELPLPHLTLDSGGWCSDISGRGGWTE